MKKQGGGIMSQIVVENLVKTFQIAKRKPGLWNATKGLVHREYSTVKAIDGISFNLNEGELVGYIGPNGAGKSTTVKILSGILVPDSGRCEVLGNIPWKNRISHVKNIGVVFGQRSQLWWDLPVIDSFELLKDIYNIPELKYKTTKDELVEILSLQQILDVPVRQLSLGQRMRCEISASLLHTPPILFLDEPTIGLDAVSKLAVREFIKDLNKKNGTTVILTTHDMDDIEALCSRVMVIGKGQILLDGTINEIRNIVSKERRLIIELEGQIKDISIDEAKVVKIEGSRVYLDFNPYRISPSELIGNISSKYKIKDLLIENQPIDEIIAKFYEDFKI
jgi:ABC-2 type transport system ATP-binding protein